MPRQKSAGPSDGLPHRVVLVAQKSAELDALKRQLEQRNCAVECAETLAEAQSVVARETPHIAFIECLQYPARVSEITGLFGAPSDRRPRLVGIGCDNCPSSDPRVCGLDAYLRLPSDDDDLEGVLALQAGDDGMLHGATNVHPIGCRELSAIDAIAHLPDDVQTAMLTAFVEYTAICFERIDTGLQTHDLGQVRRDVHAVKSGCLQLGFDTMVECCDELHRALEANDLCTARVCYLALLSAFNAVVGELPRN